MTTLPERLKELASRMNQDGDKYDAFTLLAEAVQALQAAPEGGEWRTIDSAPKDGTQILVARAGEEIGMGAVEIVDWCVMENWHWEQVGDDLYRKVQDAPSEFWNGNGHRATHWMPLPAAPSPTAALQAGVGRFVACRCVSERDRELCMTKDECSKVYAYSDTAPKEPTK